ncbi:acetylcholine receptor subunit beta-like isoform X1 [Wyeomyia smithii]|uniref:acetylcholine receptor subunit beta-like isoform X1 n=1 Tax=Wyeomyia smithii TaxID=174621 RepID=UPI002467DD9C|nr:acetylcholine receptor subunit beta-like isoform X1 [Wyeomyia smithii]
MPNFAGWWQPVTLAATAWIICCLSISGTSGSTEAIDCAHGYQGNNSELILRDALLCGTGYDIRKRPVKNQQDRVAMYIGAKVMSVELVHNSNARLEITVELSMQWFDAYLHWNKKEHADINTLSITEQEIWLPKLAAKSLLKSRTQGGSHCFQVKCHLSFNGEVMYSMLCTYGVDCFDNSRHWAFETKNCPLRIFTPDYDINQLSLFHFQRRLSYAVSGVLPYKITSFQMAIVNNTVHPEFRMDIIVERLIGPHLVVFFIFIIILFILNLVITWLRIDSSIRAVITFASLALHCAYTCILYWYASTRMEPALKLAHLLLGSLLWTFALVGLLAYSEKMSKRDCTGVPHFLRNIYRTLSRIASIKPFLQLGYINLEDPLIKPTTESSEARMTNHVTEEQSMPPLPSPPTQDTSIEQADSDEEVDPSDVKWSVFLQPFDRIVFCGIATTYVFMLMVLFLA